MGVYYGWGSSVGFPVDLPEAAAYLCGCRFRQFQVAGTSQTRLEPAFHPFAAARDIDWDRRRIWEGCGCQPVASGGSLCPARDNTDDAVVKNTSEKVVRSPQGVEAIEGSDNNMGPTMKTH